MNVLLKLQEISVLKRKVEEFEVENDKLKAKVVDYQTKLASKSTYKPITKTAQTKVIYFICLLKYKCSETSEKRTL